MYDQYRFTYRPLRGYMSPLVPVQVFYNHSQITTQAYVDSGAYYSIFLPVWARRLGIQIESGRREQVVTGNGQTISIYLHQLGMRIGDEHFSATVGFSEELGVGFNLLGRATVFEELMFCFNDRLSTLFVSRTG